MIEPISVCELDAGRPRYQVPRFQMIAATSRANTMAKPALMPTCRISSTGSSEMMPNATAPLEMQHAEEIEAARPDDRDLGRHRVGVDDRRDGIGGVVEAVDELEAERDQQRDCKQCENADRKRRRLRLAQVVHQAVEREQSASNQQTNKHDNGRQRRPGIQLRSVVGDLPVVAGGSSA